MYLNQDKTKKRLNSHKSLWIFRWLVLLTLLATALDKTTQNWNLTKFALGIIFQQWNIPKTLFL
jgi:hypothetical protein